MTKPDPQQLLTALSTEHFTLQGARSQTMSESSARASIYVFAVSSALVALGFIGQAAGTAYAARPVRELAGTHERCPDLFDSERTACPVKGSATGMLPSRRRR